MARPAKKAGKGPPAGKAAGSRSRPSGDKKIAPKKGAAKKGETKPKREPPETGKSAKTAKASKVAKKPVAPKKRAPGGAARKTAAKQESGQTGATRLLLCRLDHSAPGWVSMSWQDVQGGQSWSYRVDIEPLRRLAAEIRGAPKKGDGDEDRIVGKLEALEKVTDDFAVNPQAYGDALRALARVGADLHRAALGLAGRKDPSSSPAEFRNWFNANVLARPRGAWRIVMIHKNLEDSVVVPWGLAFATRKDPDGEDERIDDLDLTPEGMGGFWCMAFALSVVGVEYVAEDERLVELKAQQSKISVVIEVGPDALDAYSRELVSEQVDEVVIDSRSKLKAHVRSHRGLHNFFYVSLNAEGGVYRLADDPFDGEDLAGAARKIENQMAFAMLDGDCVIRGDRGRGWIEDWLMRRDRGVFAVETDIRSVSRRFFGWDFMRDSIVAGVPLIDGVALARIKHWPRSLLYGFYCTPTQAQMKPPDGFSQTITIINALIRAHHEVLLKQKAPS